jgi:hypothetical protein
MADHSTLKGTLGGLLTVTLVTIQSGELIKTAILATIGAAVSFGVSLALKKFTKWIRRSRARDKPGE